MEKKEDVHEESAYQEIFFGELKEILHSVVEQLPSRQKEIYLLSREHGLSYFEIATRLGISENTVDTQLRRALSFIREKYRQHYNK
jgi:RNA polymerase sigma-70 factor (ECF subfamily)